MFTSASALGDDIYEVSRVRESYANRRRTSRVRRDTESVRLRLAKVRELRREGLRAVAQVLARAKGLRTLNCEWGKTILICCN